MWYLKISFVLLAVFVWTTTVSQKNPNVTKFEPDKISTENVEYALSISSDGKELYFARSTGKWGKGGMKSTIYTSRMKDGSWTEPIVISFSGHYDDGDPHITQDGNTLYFVSDRPDGDHPVSQDIWKVERKNGRNWGVPQRLENPVNSGKREYSPRTDGQGNLYFASDRSGGMGQGDLYISLSNGDTFLSPMNLGEPLNSKTGEWNLEVSSEGNIIIYEASGRKENISSYGDLYISFKSNEKWSIPQNISELNTTGSDLYPQFIEEDQTLFYTSSDSLRSTDTNIYQVDFKTLLRKYLQKAVY